MREVAEGCCKCTITLQHVKDALQWVRAPEKPYFPLCTPANRADTERRLGIKLSCKCDSELQSLFCAWDVMCYLQKLDQKL